MYEYNTINFVKLKKNSKVSRKRAMAKLLPLLKRKVHGCISLPSPLNSLPSLPLPSHSLSLSLPPLSLSKKNIQSTCGLYTTLQENK